MSDTTHLRSPRTRFWLAFILCVGGLLRLATLGRQSLWLDEGASYWIANRPWTSVLAELPTIDTHPPLYYLLLQPAIALGGSEWMLRLPSALAGLSGIALIFALGQEVFDAPTGLLAAFIVAITPIQVWFGQEARMYALVVALVLAAGWFAARALRANRRLDWLLFGLCEGVALLTDVSAVWFVLAANAAWLLRLPADWRAGRGWPWLASQALALLVFLPWLPSFLHQLSNGVTNWIPAATLTGLARTLTDFVGSFEQRSTPESVFALVILAIPLAFAGRRLWREARQRQAPYLLLAGWLCVPIGLSFLASQAYVRLPLFVSANGQARSIFLTRNLLVASPPLYLLLARSLAVSRRWLATAILIGLGLMSAVSLYRNGLLDSKEDYRGAAKWVAQQAVSGDVVLFSPAYLKIPYAYYVARSPFTEIGEDVLSNGLIGPSGVQTTGSVDDLLKAAHRAWLVTTPDNIFRTDPTDLKHRLDTQDKLVQTSHFYGVTLLLYQLQNSP